MSDAERWRAVVSGESRGVGPALRRAVLAVASWPYGLAVRLRAGLYRAGWFKPHRAPVPVISVGNLTVGGTGKTPCVEFVARLLAERGHQVAILSRGYGSSGQRNDEAMVLEDNLPDVPHLQGADRVELAAIAVEELESEVLVLDDGFQHRRLARDLDIVLIDATNPWGHGHMLPRGLLREPRSGLRRAHAAIVTRCELVDDAAIAAIRADIRRIAPSLPVFEAEHAPIDLIDAAGVSHALDTIAERRVLAFCGIGNPAAFAGTLARAGISVAAMRAFPDHHAYTRDDVADLEGWVQRGGVPPLAASRSDRTARDSTAQASATPQATADAALVLTTQKDLVKLRVTALGGTPLRALRIGFRLRDGGAALGALLDAAMR